MPGPSYGALGLTFQAVRLMQVICLITVVGLSSNFISEIISVNLTPPSELVGTLSVVCVAIIYCAVSLILYIDDALPFVINAIADCLVLVAAIVVAVVVGRPLTYLNCQAIGNPGGSMTAYGFSTALGSQSSPMAGTVVDYSALSGASLTNCLEMKSIWGLSIALCILFSFSSSCSALLWKRKKLATASAAKATEA